MDLSGTLISPTPNKEILIQKIIYTFPLPHPPKTLLKISFKQNNFSCLFERTNHSAYLPGPPPKNPIFFNEKFFHTQLKKRFSTEK